MDKSEWSEIKGKVKRYFPFYLFAFLLLLSCSEETKEEGDFDNWQTKNETEVALWAADPALRQILSYSKDEDLVTSPKITDYIYVEELEKGDGTETPLFTDTVRVAYRGRYIPTKSYADGLIFEQTFVNDFDWLTAGTTKFMAGSLVNGFTTALMNMHEGDRWLVHIPYTLGYGTSDHKGSSSTIPGYTDLVFEIALFDVWHPGEYRSIFKSR